MQISKSRLKEIVKEELMKLNEMLQESELQVNDMFSNIPVDEPSLDKIQQICNKLEGFADSITSEYVGNEVEIRLEEIRTNVKSAAVLISQIAQLIQEDEY